MIFALLRAQASRRGSGVDRMTAAEPPKGRSLSGKKKMRNLGTVQVPTEAFLAVLKLDE